MPSLIGWCLLLPLTAAGPFGAPAAGTSSAPGWARPQPNLELASSFYARPAGPVGREVLAQALRAGDDDFYGMSYAFAVGWVVQFEQGQEGHHRTTEPANILIEGRYHFGGRHREGALFSADLGFGAVMGLTTTAPSPARRISRAAYGHALAMQGVWDAWQWAPERGGLLVPGRLASTHPLGAWTGQAALDAGLVLTVPDSEAGERDPGRIVQARLGYTVWPRPWLAVGGRYQFVWMPTAVLFRTQSAVAPSLAVVLGRWKVETELLANVDEPYGWMGTGQRIWAFRLALGMWL